MQGDADRAEVGQIASQDHLHKPLLEDNFLPDAAQPDLVSALRRCGPADGQRPPVRQAAQMVQDALVGLRDGVMGLIDHHHTKVLVQLLQAVRTAEGPDGTHHHRRAHLLRLSLDDADAQVRVDHL